MEDGAIALWVACAGFVSLLALAFGELTGRSLFGERPTGSLPDTRVAFMLAVGAWLCARLVVDVTIAEMAPSAPVAMVIAVGAHVLVALLVLRAAMGGSRHPDRGTPAQIGYGILVGLATFGIVYVLSLALIEFYGAFGISPEDIPQQGAVSTLAASSLWGRLLIIFSACVMAPFAEEVFYRGILFPVFARRMSEPLALVVQALVFGFVHFWGDPLRWPLAIPIAAVGWCAGWLYARTGSLRGAIVLHMVFNGIQIALFLGANSA